MLLEVLIVLLLIGAVAATLLSFFVVRPGKPAKAHVYDSKHDVDNPQRDIDSQ